MVVDDSTEFSTILWKLLVEFLLQNDRVIVVSGKDDGLADLCASFISNPFFHQVLENDPLGVEIEYRSINLFGVVVDGFRIGFRFFKLPLLPLGHLGILDSTTCEIGADSFDFE